MTRQGKRCELCGRKEGGYWWVNELGAVVCDSCAGGQCGSKLPNGRWQRWGVKGQDWGYTGVSKDQVVCGSCGGKPVMPTDFVAIREFGGFICTSCAEDK